MYRNKHDDCTKWREVFYEYGDRKTVNEIAQLICVSLRTAFRYIDTGELSERLEFKGYKLTILKYNERRIFYCKQIKRGIHINDTYGN